MAVLQTGPLNTSEYVRTMPQGDPLPPGVYTGIVVRTAQKQTNDQTGVFVEVEFDITSPADFANRKFWDRFNVLNASAEAARIGKEGLSDLAAAAGIPVLSDDEELMGREVLMELIMEPAKEYTDKRTNEKKMGKAQNKCRKYWPVGTDLESAKKAQKEAAKQQTAAPAAAAPRPAANPAVAAQPAANRWGAGKPAAPAPVARPAAAPAPAATVAPAQPVAAPAAQPAAAAPVAAASGGSAAPWKRNKQ